MSKILLCKECLKYTLKPLCPLCKTKTVDPSPPRYSPQDKYGAYRRKMKHEILLRKKMVDKDE